MLGLFLCVLCSDFSLVSMRIRLRIQLFTSTRIQIRGRTNAEPSRSGSGFWSNLIKSWFFYMNNITYGGNRSKNIPTWAKSLFERLEIKFLLNLGHFPCSLIRVPKTVWIRIQERAKSACGSGFGSTTLLYLLYLSFCVGGCWGLNQRLLFRAKLCTRLLINRVPFFLNDDCST
jgi:hypothetical protein